MKIEVTEVIATFDLHGEYKTCMACPLSRGWCEHTFTDAYVTPLQKDSCPLKQGENLEMVIAVREKGANNEEVKNV